MGVKFVLYFPELETKFISRVFAGLILLLQNFHLFVIMLWIFIARKRYWYVSRNEPCRLPLGSALSALEQRKTCGINSAETQLFLLLLQDCSQLRGSLP